MDSLSPTRRFSPQEFAALFDDAKARAALARVEAFDAAWAALVAGTRRLAGRIRRTTFLEGRYPAPAPRAADFR